MDGGGAADEDGMGVLSSSFPSSMSGVSFAFSFPFADGARESL